jgi:Beige/BEACH-like protein
VAIFSPISQFTYLSILNQISGRTPSDATQYPVFRMSSSQTKNPRSSVLPQHGYCKITHLKIWTFHRKTSSGSKSSLLQLGCFIDSADIEPDTADGCADPSKARGGPVSLRQSRECRREAISLWHSFQLLDDCVPFLDQIGPVYEYVQNSAGEIGPMQSIISNIFLGRRLGFT